MLESLNYSFRNPKKHNLSNLPHQTVEKLQKKKHGVLRGPQLGKQRWQARLGILRVKYIILRSCIKRRYWRCKFTFSGAPYVIIIDCNLTFSGITFRQIVTKINQTFQKLIKKNPFYSSSTHRRHGELISLKFLWIREFCECVHVCIFQFTYLCWNMKHIWNIW